MVIDDFVLFYAASMRPGMYAGEQGDRTEYDWRLDAAKALLDTRGHASLYVVKRDTVLKNKYLGRGSNNFTTFDKAKFYQTKAPATSALYALSRYYPDELSVVEIKVVEPSTSA